MGSACCRAIPLSLRLTERGRRRIAPAVGPPLRGRARRRRDRRRLAVRSLTHVHAASPHPSHSIAGELAGGIFGVEIYKSLRADHRIDRADLVGPIALGIAVGRLGCLSPACPKKPTEHRRRCPGRSISATASAAIRSSSTEPGDARFLLGIYLPRSRGARAWTLTPLSTCSFSLRGAALAWEFSQTLIAPGRPLDLFSQLLALAMILYALIFDAQRPAALADSRTHTRKSVPWSVLRPDPSLCETCWS